VFGLVLGEAMCHYVSSVESMPAIYWLAFNTLRHTHIDVPVGRFALRKVMRSDTCRVRQHDMTPTHMITLNHVIFSNFIGMGVFVLCPRLSPCFIGDS
jgi:hypothetical protein